MAECPDIIIRLYGIGGPMDANEYQDLVMRTCISKPFQEKVQMTALGLAGEAGEVVELIKKHVYHGKPFDHEKLSAELGDVLWYVAALASTCGLSLASVMVRNIEKLEKRYPQGFVEGGGVR